MNPNHNPDPYFVHLREMHARVAAQLKEEERLRYASQTSPEHHNLAAHREGKAGAEDGDAAHGTRALISAAE